MVIQFKVTFTARQVGSSSVQKETVILDTRSAVDKFLSSKGRQFSGFVTTQKVEEFGTGERFVEPKEKDRPRTTTRSEEEQERIEAKAKELADINRRIRESSQAVLLPAHVNVSFTLDADKSSKLV